MKKTTKKIIIASSISLVFVGVGTGYYEVNAHHFNINKNAPLTFSRVKVISDATLINNSAPTSPIVDGQVNLSFINRFNAAISLSNGQYVINQKLIPLNASTEEVSTLNQLVNQQNQGLKQIISTTPKADIAQSGNSVIVGQTPQVTQAQEQQNQIITTTTYHEGSNYFHSYWWGDRIGISRTTLRKSSPALAFLSAVPAAKVIPYLGWVFSGAMAALSVETRSAKGGIVFNYCGGLFAAGAYPIWGMAYQ
ncbi:MAG: hypothetical protein LBI43_06405 [Streptococcaceae bacterium]|nr:hypothetical protein [Streptococcaceae bacterium]